MKKSHPVWVTPNQHISTIPAALSHTVLLKWSLLSPSAWNLEIFMHLPHFGEQTALLNQVSRHRARDDHMGMSPGVPQDIQGRDLESSLKARNGAWSPHELHFRLRAPWHDGTASLGQSWALGRDLENPREVAPMWGVPWGVGPGSQPAFLRSGQRWLWCS